MPPSVQFYGGYWDAGTGCTWFFKPLLINRLDIRPVNR